MHLLESLGKKIMQFVQPDNWHVHLREVEQLPYTVPYSARQFGRILAMPNTVKPLSDVREVLCYQNVVRSHGLACNVHFEPYVALYLTDDTMAQDLRKAHAAGIIAAKLYPMGATTQSHKGVSSLEKIFPVLEVMQDVDMVLSVHCEVKDDEVDFFDRERVFIDRYLNNIIQRFPKLRVVVEHVSTKEAVQFVMFASQKVAATITPQHLMLNRNALFTDGLMPSRFCFPVINSREDQKAVVQAVMHERFFLGTDSAPHAMQMKCREGGNGGCFTEPHALALYAEIFDRMGILGSFEDFASLRGARFYGFAPNENMVQMTREKNIVSDYYRIGDDISCMHFMHGASLAWKFDGMV